jgi:hypothetical protein
MTDWQGPGVTADVMGREIPECLSSLVLGKQSFLYCLWPWVHESDSGVIRWESNLFVHREAPSSLVHIPGLSNSRREWHFSHHPTCSSYHSPKPQPTYNQLYSLLDISNSCVAIAKLWKQPKCPTTNEWIKEMWYLHTMEFYSVTKKNEILSFASKCIEMENTIISEVSQPQKSKNHMFSLICRL